MIRNQKRPLQSKVFLAGLTLICAIACPVPTLADEPPSWINTESTQYPRERYLSGVGDGDSRKAAEDQAYAAVSRIFKANIQSKTREWEKYLQLSKSDKGLKGRPQISRQVMIEQLTQVSSGKVLENVFIAETWADPESDRTYALAVMDRVHSTVVIKGRIAELDRKAHLLFESATQADTLNEPSRTGSRLQVTRDLHAALRTLLLREGLNTDLKIINPAGQGVDSPIQIARVAQAVRRSLYQDFLVALEVSGHYAEKIRSAMIEGLTQEGLVIIDRPPLEGGGKKEIRPDLTGDVLIKGQMELEPIQLQGRPFFRWRVQFKLIDPVGERVIGNVTRHGREGHLTQTEAEARAVRAVQHVVKEEVGPAVAGIILGPD